MKDKGLRYLLRRRNQLLQVLQSPQLRDADTIFAAMRARYQQTEEVRFYSDYVKVGLSEHEKLAAVRSLRGNSMRRALVVGCGAGREVFGLEELGFQVIGIDVAPHMIEAARKIARQRQSQVRFQVAEPGQLQTSQVFDLVLVAGGIPCHIPGQKRRVAFFQKLLEHSHSTTVLVTSLACTPLSFFSRYYWASLILRLRWMNDWEKGDSARSFLGRHNTCSELVYFHFYPDEDTVHSELELAGWQSEKLIDEAWLCSPIADKILSYESRSDIGPDKSSFQTQYPGIEMCQPRPEQGRQGSPEGS